MVIHKFMMRHKNLKKYFNFVIAYFLVPSTPTFYLFMQYMHPLIAYFASLFIWGTILYLWYEYKLKRLK